MRLESALYANRSGTLVHGQAISVISDNISNSNTTAYKSSKVQFSDLLSGTNSSDNSSLAVSGSGVQLQSVKPIFQNGVIEFTGKNLDLAIEGNGFFLVGDADNPLYSRAGTFGLNDEGLLVNGAGDEVLGYTGDSETLGTLDMVNVVVSAEATSRITLKGNLDSRSPITTIPDTIDEFTDIGESATTSTVFSSVDSLGEQHDILFALYKTAPNTWKARAYIDGGEVGGTAGAPVQIGEETTLNFSSTGGLTGEVLLTATPAYSNGSNPGNFAVDLSNYVQLATGSEIKLVSSDGQLGGSVESYDAKSDGRLFATLDSGTQTLIGTIALANFTNVDGLQRAGNSAYVEGTNVGTRTVDNPGESGLGELRGGSLERSTVDLAEQYVELIFYQRGFQANAQNLSTVSQLLQQIISLK